MIVSFLTYDDYFDCKQVMSREAVSGLYQYCYRNHIKIILCLNVVTLSVTEHFAFLLGFKASKLLLR